MTPDELLRRYPRETLRWLRQRLGLSQLDFALRLGVSPATPTHSEARRRALGPANRKLLAAMLKPHLATPEGQDFVRSLEGEG